MNIEYTCTTVKDMAPTIKSYCTARQCDVDCLSVHPSVTLCTVAKQNTWV